VPLVSRSRVMLSSQMLWPSSWSFCVAFMASPLHSLESWGCRKQVTQIAVEQVSDPVHRHVGCKARDESVRVMRILSLSGKDRGDAGAPSLLDRGKDTRLVIHQDIVQRRIAGLDIIERKFLMDVDEHV